MTYGGSKLKNPKKCDLYAIFYHFNRDIFNCKGLPIENTIVSSYSEPLKFNKPH